MSDLRARLSRLKAKPPAAVPPTRGDLIAELRSQMDRVTRAETERRRMEAAPYAGPGIEALVPGAFHRGKGGEFFVARAKYPFDYCHGNKRLDVIFDKQHEVFGELTKDPELADLAPGQTVFIDTETTGLSGGTGTYAFLIGIGYFEGQDFVVEQFLMRDESEEVDMLALLSERLAQFRYLASFNGKSFDLPLIESLEEQLLGIERVDDVPGELIPGIYFDFLRRGDPTRMERVFYHNQLDILSMVTLTALISDVIGDRAASCCSDGMEHYSVGRIHLERGRVEEAEAAFTEALKACPYSDQEWEILRHLSVSYKRSGKLPLAVKTWKEMIGIDPRRDLFPWIELAKYYEHRQRDFGRAAGFAAQAMELPFLSPVETEALEYRLQRLRHKGEGDTLPDDEQEDDDG
jgi:tetratricopeptide (TPR) repeat protein